MATQAPRAKKATKRTRMRALPPVAYSVEEAARVTRLSRAMVYRAIQHGALRAVHVGRAVRILPEDLDAWLDSMRTPEVSA